MGTIFRFHPRLFSTKLECETTPLVLTELVIVLLSGTGLQTDSSLFKDHMNYGNTTLNLHSVF